ncbi:MAG: hypothetical protein AAB893_00225 [Patescibacteria group bacterium]
MDNDADLTLEAWQGDDQKILLSPEESATMCVLVGEYLDEEVAFLEELAKEKDSPYCEEAIFLLASVDDMREHYSAIDENTDFSSTEFSDITSYRHFRGGFCPSILV